MVEIIPKKVPKIPPWLNILFYFSLAFLAFTMASYFILDHSLKEGRKELSQLEESLAEKKIPENLVLEQRVLNYQKKIKDFSQLIDQHLATSKVFDFIERICHPQVWFSQFSFDAREKTAIISGQTQGFESLGQQLLIFQEADLVQKVGVENISISKEGRVEFTLSLSFDPKIISYQEE